MDATKTFICDNIKTIAVGVCVAGVSVFIAKRVYGKKKRKKRICGIDYPKDTVMVHQFGKGDLTPSWSHFVVKLETYLRIHNISYEPVYGIDLGPKKKVPWIEYNGVTMGDSQLIINYLNEKFNVNLNKSLSKEQRAVAWAIQKWIEEFTYHLNVYIRWCLLTDDMPAVVPSIPKYWLYFTEKFIRKMEYSVGTARHSAQEVYDMMVFDLRQLSLILGDKKYLMGGDGPTEVDCAAFGILTQIRWCTPDSCPGKQALTGELQNLMWYINRIKQTYWRDWDERIIGLKKTE